MSKGVKTGTSLTNITNNGVFNDDIVTSFCNKYKISRLFPSNEID